MTLDEIKSKLGDDVDGIGSAIEGLIKAESEKFIGLKSKLNKENESVRGRLNRTLAALGYESGDVDEFLESYKSKSTATVTEKNTLEKKLNDIMTALDRERKEKEAIAVKTKHKTIESALKDAFKNVPSAPFVIRSLIADGVVDVEEGDRIKFTFDGEDLDFKTGVQRFLDNNKSLVQIKQEGGGTGGASAAAQKKTITRKEFNSLPIDKQSEYFKAGGDVVD